MLLISQTDSEMQDKNTSQSLFPEAVPVVHYITRFLDTSLALLGVLVFIPPAHVLRYYQEVRPRSVAALRQDVTY
jgi:hypothetical protein